jgi:hypothetical protein
MNLLFVIGLEGTGHHLFKDCCNYQENPILHDALLYYFHVNATEETRTRRKKEINSFIRSNKDSNVIERASFPYNLHGTLQSYGIEEFYKLFSGNKDVNVFFTIVVRNIVYSTLSIHNRRLDHSVRRSVIDEAKVQEKYLTYINDQVQLLPSDRYMVVEYNDICNNAETFENILQKRSRFDNILFDAEKVKPPDDSKHIGNEHYACVVNYFTRERTKHFDHLMSNLTRLRRRRRRHRHRRRHLQKPQTDIPIIKSTGVGLIDFPSVEL